jgi:hypothetical protein
LHSCASTAQQSSNSTSASNILKNDAGRLHSRSRRTFMSINSKISSLFVFQRCNHVVLPHDRSAHTFAAVIVVAYCVMFASICNCLSWWYDVVFVTWNYGPDSCFELMWLYSCSHCSMAIGALTIANVMEAPHSSCLTSAMCWLSPRRFRQSHATKALSLSSSRLVYLLLVKSIVCLSEPRACFGRRFCCTTRFANTTISMKSLRLGCLVCYEEQHSLCLVISVFASALDTHARTLSCHREEMCACAGLQLNLVQHRQRTAQFLLSTQAPCTHSARSSLTSNSSVSKAVISSSQSATTFAFLHSTLPTAPTRSRC